MRVVDGGDDQVLQELDVVLRDDLRIDRDRADLLETVHGDGDHSAAGRGRRGLDLGCGQVLVELLVHLLRLLHQLLDTHRVFSVPVVSRAVIVGGVSAVRDRVRRNGARSGGQALMGLMGKRSRLGPCRERGDGAPQFFELCAGARRACTCCRS